jgi:hypothetical protein
MSADNPHWLWSIPAAVMFPREHLRLFINWLRRA